MGISSCRKNFRRSLADLANLMLKAVWRICWRRLGAASREFIGIADLYANALFVNEACI